MNAIMPIAPIDVAKADFAERAGKEHFKRIRAELASKAVAPGTLVGINVIDGQYVLAGSDLELIDAFRVTFGAETIGWFAEFWDC